VFMTEENKEEVFVKNLKSLRTINKLSQKQVADKLGVPVSTYANWEQGRRMPSINEIYKLIKVFETDANELFDIN
ncbi:MAG: helix-turn-helix domain-containing protein, partial [Clostridia bacterium]|nr:helix-turn-helix domain-containing protein [Clostridia bacterium]